MLSLLVAATSALALARTAHATISVTFPIGASSCNGGQPCGPIKWQIDDSILPLGSSFGETSVGIYTGSVDQQTLFFDIGTVSDPTTMLELPAVAIPANLGPNGDFYFVRFQSNEAVDPATGYPLQAFSAKFRLTGMTGELSEEALAQISGVPRAVAPSSATRTLTNTRMTSNTNSGSASSTGTARIGSNAQVTGAKNNVSDTGAAHLGYKSGMTVSLAAFLGTAAYLTL